MKVLCTGDLHIGRRPSRLPGHVDCRPLSCANVWSEIVTYAIAQDVDAVALSGDLVDEKDKFFEAIGPLELGIRRLGKAGITTVAVAGNHDHDVLPRLARVLNTDSFRLLGRGGHWQRTTVNGRDGEKLHIDGWSFPAQHVRVDPVADYALTPDGDTPILGLLHADLDVAGSRYAPVTQNVLMACPVSFWLLGHKHAPELRTSPGSPSVLYPGSPQPVDPGEPGVHGVWLLELRPGAPVRPLSIPLASVRYATLELDVTESADASGLRELVTDRLRAAAAPLVEDGGDALRYLSLRIRLVGSIRRFGDIEREIGPLSESLELDIEGVTTFVERVENATRPAIDLATEARGSTAVAVLARVLLGLDAETMPEECTALVREAERMAATLCRAKPYASVAGADDALDAPALRGAIRRQAMLLLDDLIAHQEPA